MSHRSVFTAAAILTALAATPVSAQEVIRNPGAFAFFHPYLDVLNGGAPTPAFKLSSDPAAMQAYAARESGIGKPATSAAANQRNPDLSSYRQTLASSHPSRKDRPGR
jgi:hypothetical protein